LSVRPDQGTKRVSLPAAGRLTLTALRNGQVGTPEREVKAMKIFLWIAFLILVAIAIFAVHNSSAPPVIIKFLIWKFETSLVYTILGSVALGILLTLLFWIQRAIGTSLRKKDLNKKNHSGSS
jgi:putative membrane protein